MINVILTIIIVAVIACAAIYIVKAKMRGEKCIGCKGCSCDTSDRAYCNCDCGCNCQLAAQIEQTKTNKPFQTIS